MLRGVIAFNAQTGNRLNQLYLISLVCNRMRDNVAKKLIEQLTSFQYNQWIRQSTLNS